MVEGKWRSGVMSRYHGSLCHGQNVVTRAGDQPELPEDMHRSTLNAVTDQVRKCSTSQIRYHSPVTTHAAQA